jgi:2-polyprenyl-3-methyl-5-hydroxy-6-metoxy-1,4-benzoquinol methylase
LVDQLPDLAALKEIGTPTLGAWRAACADAGFDEACIAQYERVAPRLFDRVRLPVVHEALRRSNDSASRLARLFAYRDSLSNSELSACLPGAVLEALISSGVLIETEGRIRSKLRLIPFEGLLILSDEMDASGDPVMGPGATTLELARMMRCQAGNTILDVGCGAGTLALAAAKQGANATGVDLHPRAIEFSELNARLNGLTATFHAGDLLDPVGDRRFDLIVSQPPFVITPPGMETTTYLHGGERGDELAFRLVSELPGALSLGARALVLFDTPLAGERLRDSVKSAVANGHPSSQLALVAPGHHADGASLGYAAVQHPELDVEYGAAVARYRQHLASLSIERVQHVLLSLWRLRNDEPELSASLEVPGLAAWDAEALGRLQQAAELAAVPDGTLVQRSVSIAPDCLLIEERPVGKAEGGRVVVRFAGHRFADRELSDAALVLIDSIQQGGRLDEVIQRFATAASALGADVQSRVLDFVRESLVSGLLVPRQDDQRRPDPRSESPT